VPILELGMHLEGKSHQKLNHSPDLIKDALEYIDSAKLNARYAQTSTAINFDPPTSQENNDQYQYRFEFTNFIIQNNLPFNLTDKLNKFINDVAHKYTRTELSSFKIDRKCISEIAGNFISPYFQEIYLNILKKTPFSLSLDEGSLKGNIEYLAINARYLPSSTSLLTTTKLISLIQLEGSKTGETLYKLLVSLLFTGEDGELRKNNCLGICTDGASNMISTGTASLTSRLLEIMPNLVIIHDFSHVFNLILKDCINQHFPKAYIKIVKNICKKFQNSPKQVSLLKQQMLENQNKFPNRKVLAVKRYIETRWSSFEEALERIVDIKDDLQEFFGESESQEERNYFNQRNILMFELLLFLVKLINTYILAFQKENWDMIEIITTLKECIVIFSSFVYKRKIDESSQRGNLQETSGDLD
jgi:hypothetical protein